MKILSHSGRFNRCLLFFALAVASLSCGSPDSAAPKNLPEVQIFAAAGTRLATEELCDRYEKAGNVKVSRNFASSGTLARQIASGAEADVFVSANKQWIEFLKEKGLLTDGSVYRIAGNALVLIAPKGAAPMVPTFDKVFDIGAAIKDKIVIGDPSYVPVGKYAKAAFDNLGWFEKIQNKMIMAKDVSSALNYVALGEVDWGVVYRSEAIASNRVEIIATIPATLHNPIEFFVADLKKQNPEARPLSKLFRSKEGLSIFLKHGFLEIDGTAGGDAK